jgi:hypothetical protein
MALAAAGIAFIVVKKMTNKPKPVAYGGGGYGKPPGYRDQSSGFNPMSALGGFAGGGAASSFMGGGGGGGQAASFYGAAPGSRDIGSTGFGGAPTPDYQTILRTLNQCIQEQHIGFFYQDPRAVDAIAQRIVASGAIADISQEWRLTPDIAVDLCKLALFDIVVLCDDSAAMRGEQGGERINDLRATLSKVSYAATLFDDDGIEVRFLNAPFEGNRINSDEAAVQLLDRIIYDGPCALGSALDYKVLQPLVLGPARARALHKPKLIIIITGGTGALYSEAPNTLNQVITRAAQELSQSVGADAISFQFCQVGNDMQAAQWLGHLDADPAIGGLMDQTGDFDAERDEMRRKTGQELTPVMWLLKMMLGGIDNSYDSKDE